MAHANNTKQTKGNNIEVLNPCTCCGETKSINFFKSFNPIFKQTQRICVCKKCLENEYQKYLNQFNDGKLALFYLCRKFDIFYANSAYEGALNQSAKMGWSIVSSYLKQINSFRDENSVSKNGYGLCFDESFEFLDRVVINNQNKSSKEDIENDKSNSKINKKKNKKIILDEYDKKNRDDVIRLLDYDPFENEDERDFKFLYSRLIDFLDESTLEDSFKCGIVIEITKSFNQIEKINQALAAISVDDVATNIKDIKALMHTKTTTLSSILSMAKDNGISVNHSNNKSKGAGTLSGIMKKLGELDLYEAKINMFDINTAMGMKQVADISNKSIMETLQFDENDYSEMLKEQRKMIDNMKSKIAILEEENRILKYNKTLDGG